MYESRLLSWPAYFWYRRGILPVRATQAVRFPHVPIGHELHAVGIRVRHENDAVVQDALRLGVGPARELPERLDELLRAQHFGGVQSAVDPDDDLAFARQARAVAESTPSRLRESARDVLVAREIAVIGRARDDRHDLRTSLFRHADGVEHDAVALAGHLREVLMQLGVVRQHVVGADLVPEERFGRGDARLRIGGGGRQERCTHKGCGYGRGTGDRRPNGSQIS